MPEIANVQPSGPIAVSWGNSIRDRTVQRYASAAGRTTNHPSPAAGDMSYLADVGEVEFFHGSVWRSFLPAGVVLPYGGTTAPTGFLLAQGQAVSRTTYAGLFAVLGTTFGIGDGSTTFNLPDLRQRFPMGKADTGTGSTLGSTGGAIDHSHTGPSHTHTGPSHTHTGPSHTHTMGTHTHTGPSHTHSFSDSFTTGIPSSSVSMSTGVASVASTGHTHSGSVSGTTGSGGTGVTGATDPGDTAAAGTGATGASGTANTGASSAASSGTDGTGATGSGGTGATGSGGTGATGTANAPYQVLNYIVKH